jgi:hypothetical protein
MVQKIGRGTGCSILRKPSESIILKRTVCLWEKVNKHKGKSLQRLFFSVGNGNKLPPRGSFVYVQSKSMADNGLLFFGKW